MEYEVIDGKGIIPDGTTEIAFQAFKGCNSLQSIVIPDSVTEIGRWAFAHCSSLQSIEIVTQEKELDLSLERIEYLLQALSEYSKVISLRAPIGCGYARSEEHTSELQSQR